jgi:hypothetical protein
VAITGTTAVIGAKGSAHGAHMESGAVFVFTLTAQSSQSLMWRFSHTLQTPEGSFDEFTGFGHAVAIHRDTIIVTSYEEQRKGAVFGYNLVEPEKGEYYWVNSFARESSSGEAGDRFGDCVTVFDDIVMVGSPGSSYGYVYSYVSNATVNAMSFVPLEEETFFEAYELPPAALALFSIAGIVLVLFVLVRFGGSMKKKLNSIAGNTSDVVNYEDVDMDSEHSTRSLGLTEVEQHRFLSRNPLNNRF